MTSRSSRHNSRAKLRRVASEWVPIEIRQGHVEPDSVRLIALATAFKNGNGITVVQWPMDRDPRMSE